MMTGEKSGKSWFARHKILTVIMAVIIIAAITSASGGNKSTGNNNKSNDSSSSQASRPETKAATAKIGQAVRDGKFEFTVNSVKCGETSVGSQYLNKTAQGQYCRLNLTVKNIGNEKQTLSSSEQFLYNSSNQKYSSDDTANIYAASTTNSGAGSTWYSDINPGNSVTGDVLFDLPKDQTPVTAELHDSAFSSGVKVTLQ